MKEIINSYVKRCDQVKKKREGIYNKISGYKIKIENLEKNLKELKLLSWVDEIVEPLAKILSIKLNKKYEIYGPFGLRCDTTIYLFDDEEKSITQQPTLSITLLPRSLLMGEIHYETGEVIDEFEKGTIGEMNGMNNVAAPLPETIDEIIKILR